ncbi:anti-sigma factor domain-containing protein [Streptomyces sp. NPDC056337]|uniref:anti-sigma factor n=1 Tax=Streptomyces sp. NPDC056337 TaxID=3345787 RepID=UPI0035D9E892
MTAGGGDPHLDVGAYTLHALPPDEEAAFENHLASCPACREEAAELAATAALLAAAELRTPSPEVRRRVLAQIGTVRQERRVAPDRDPAAAAAPAARRRRGGRRALGFALAASVAAAAALGGIAWWQHSEADTAREQVHEAEAGAETLAGVLAASDATISTTTLSDGATASVVTSRAEGEAAFIAAGLPPLSGDQVYELWYARGDEHWPAGLLPGTGGDLAHVMDGPLRQATTVGITVEPAGGSPQPTTKPLGVIALPA